MEYSLRWRYASGLEDDAEGLPFDDDTDLVFIFAMVD
jgi:hypothetical protein